MSVNPSGNTRIGQRPAPLPGACARLTDAELAANGVVQCRLWKSSMIYRSDLRQEKNDRLMSVHTPGEIGHIQ